LKEPWWDSVIKKAMSILTDAAAAEAKFFKAAQPEVALFLEDPDLPGVSSSSERFLLESVFYGESGQADPITDFLKLGADDIQTLTSSMSAEPVSPGRSQAGAASPARSSLFFE